MHRNDPRGTNQTVKFDAQKRATWHRSHGRIRRTKMVRSNGQIQRTYGTRGLHRTARSDKRKRDTWLPSDDQIRCTEIGHVVFIGRTEIVQIRRAEMIHVSTIKWLGRPTVRWKWYGCYQNPTATIAWILQPGKRHVAEVIGFGISGNPEPVSADPVKNASDDAEIGRRGKLRSVYSWVRLLPSELFIVSPLSFKTMESAWRANQSQGYIRNSSQWKRRPFHWF